MEKPNNILKDELRELAPELSKLERKNPFEVPPDYFDDLSLKIQNRISYKKEEKHLWYSVLFNPKFSIAASIIIILMVSGLVSYKYYQKQSANTKNIYWDEIMSENNSINYSFDENSLVETLADLTPEMESEQIIKSDSTLKNISTDDLNEYINNNNNDIFYEN